jgi:hypothetical protein
MSAYLRFPHIVLFGDVCIAESHVPRPRNGVAPVTASGAPNDHTLH